MKNTEPSVESIWVPGYGRVRLTEEQLAGLAQELARLHQASGYPLRLVRRWGVVPIVQTRFVVCTACGAPWMCAAAWWAQVHLSALARSWGWVAGTMDSEW